MEQIAAVIVGSVFVEALLDYFFPKVEGEAPRPWIKYVAAVFGVLFCVVYKIDMLALFGLVTDVTYVGAGVTGVLMGRGSNYIHDFLALLKR